MVKVKKFCKTAIYKPTETDVPDINEPSEPTKIVDQPKITQESMFLQLPHNVLEMICEKSETLDLVSLTETSSYMNQFVGTLNTFQNRTKLTMLYDRFVNTLKGSNRGYKTLVYNALQDKNSYTNLKYVLGKFQRSLEDIELFLLPVSAYHFQRLLQKMKRVEKLNLKFVIYEDKQPLFDLNQVSELPHLKELIVKNCDMKILRHFKQSKVTKCCLDFKVIDNFRNNVREDLNEAPEFLAHQTDLTHLTLKDTAFACIFDETNLSDFTFQLEYLHTSICKTGGVSQNAINFENFVKAQKLKQMHVLVDISSRAGSYLRAILGLPLLTEVNFNLKRLNFSDDDPEFPVNRSIKIATFQNNFEPRCLTFHELFLLNSLQGLEEFNCQFFEIDHNLLKILDTLPNLKKITWHNCKIWEMTTLPTVQEIVFENSCRVLSITNRFLECNRHIKKLTMAITNHFRQDIVSANEWIYTILALTALEFLDLSKFGYNKILALAIINHKSLKTIVLPKNGNPNRMESNEVEDKESVKILKDKMTVIFK